MREMGSRAFDPIPPDNYLYFVHDESAPPLQRALAWVRAHTIRYGHRSPFCVDEDGNELTLEHMAADFKWSVKHARCTWEDLEDRGLVKLDRHKRLCLKGDTPLPTAPPDDDEDSELDNAKNLYRFFPKYLAKQIQQLSEDARRRLIRDYRVYTKFQDRVKAEVMAKARAIEEEMDAQFFAQFGIEVRRNKKTRENGNNVVQITLNDMPENVVQVFQNPVQPDSAILYNAKNGAVQDLHPIYTEKTEKTETLSSSSSSVEEPPEPTTTKKSIAEGIDVGLRTLLVGNGALTRKQSAEVQAVITELPAPELAARAFLDEHLPERLPRIKHVGALPAIAREFAALWPERLKQMQAHQSVADAETDQKQRRETRQREKDAQERKIEQRIDQELNAMSDKDRAQLRARAMKQIRQEYPHMPAAQQAAMDESYIRAFIRGRLEDT